MRGLISSVGDHLVVWSSGTISLSFRLHFYSSKLLSGFSFIIYICFVDSSTNYIFDQTTMAQEQKPSDELAKHELTL